MRPKVIKYFLPEHILLEQPLTSSSHLCKTFRKTQNKQTGKTAPIPSLTPMQASKSKSPKPLEILTLKKPLNKTCMRFNKDQT
ncbi:hypothetical protein BJX62DRAFT_220347 [Aspergillus germanicus]